MKPFNGANTTCDILPQYNPFTYTNEHVNFIRWNTNFVARCNIARLGNDMRKYALHCMTAGRAQEYVTHVHNRRYSYIYKHLIQHYGDGSAHVGYQEQFDTVIQHNDERIEEYDARSRTAIKRRFGKRFKLDTTKSMSDLIRFVANDDVKSQLAALKLRKFDDVMPHGRRLEKEAATYGFSCKFGPAVNTPISLPVRFFQTLNCFAYVRSGESAAYHFETKCTTTLAHVANTVQSETVNTSQRGSNGSNCDVGNCYRRHERASIANRPSR